MAAGPFIVSTVHSQWAKAEAKLRKAAEHEALRGVRKAISKETLTARKRIRSAALEKLPHKGGLNKWAAVLPTALTRQTADGFSVRIRMQRGKHDFKDLDRGQIRHPVFGNRKTWVNETVNGGFFTREIEALKPELEHAVSEAFRKYAEEFNRP